MTNEQKFALLQKMTQFTGTKTVKAMEMKLGEAEELMERKMYKDGQGDPEAKGYLVLYEDSYLSWSPMFTFQMTYKPSHNYFERMKNELDEVKERYLKGRDFTFSQQFRRLNETQRDLLRKQLDAMEHYLYILSRRIQIEVELDAAGCDGGRNLEPGPNPQSESGNDAAPSGEK